VIWNKLPVHIRAEKMSFITFKEKVYEYLITQRGNIYDNK